MRELHQAKGVSSARLEGETMIPGKFTLAMFLMTAPGLWAQYSRDDMIKLATDRSNTAAQTLKLSPDQVAKITPLLQSQCVDIGQVKDVYRSSDKSDTARKTAKDSLRAIHDKYNAKIAAILTPEQLKEWKHMQRDWRGDLSTPKS